MKNGIETLKKEILKRNGIVFSVDTLKLDDLLTSAYDFLSNYDIRKNGIRKQIKECFFGDPSNINYYFGKCKIKEQKEEEASFLFNETIYNTFNEICPDGFYFGTSEGDGACFGFFRLEE